MMDKNIKALQPQALWENFHAITQIPHPSGVEEQIRDFVFSFGEKLGLETKKDEVGNILIRKPATPGMENRKGIVLQGHLDMVPQKNSDKVHDFAKDPIEAYIDGDWVTANGTTLGADNGIGVAAAMAILQSKDLKHGPVEALFTATEETGMDGAFGLQPNWIEGDILLNLDSEDEGELYVGCAGGVDVNVGVTYDQLIVPQSGVPLQVKISGLKGGHSGMDIVLGRGNANKLLVRFLRKITREYLVQVGEIKGGGLRNAIPREAEATIVVWPQQVEAVKDAVKEYEAMYKNELSATEPDILFEIKDAEMPVSVMEEVVMDSMLDAIHACPNGVVRMSDAMPGLVETSSNLASVTAKGGEMEVCCLLRSSVDSAKEELVERIESVFTLADAEVSAEGGYPGWKPNMDSPILKTTQKVYEEKWGKVPEVKAIHAGLECGLLGAVYPAWDMISFGPTIRFPHSPDEKVNIASVAKFWEFLTLTLENVPVE